jgi:hypothetical protein
MINQIKLMWYAKDQVDTLDSFKNLPFINNLYS